MIMNKKTYIVPRQKTIHLDAEDMIAGSILGGPQMLSEGDEKEEDGVAEVKAFNLWDEW